MRSLRVPWPLILYPFLFVSGIVISVIMPLLFGTITRPIPTEEIVALGACEAADSETVYAETDRRLLCAVGSQRAAIRAVRLRDLEGALVSPARYGPVVNHGALVEFSPRKE
jgi:hypothetical protein